MSWAAVSMPSREPATSTAASSRSRSRLTAGGQPPAVNLERERELAAVLVAGSRDGMLTAAHDISDGGLATTLAEMCLRFGYGARIALPEGSDPFVELFSESAGRAVVAVPLGRETRFTDLCE